MSRGWHDVRLLRPESRPWINPRKGTSRKLSAGDCELIRDHLLRDPRMKNQEVSAPDTLSILQDSWTRMGREDPVPQMYLQTVR
jgi:hypothetical protein